MVNQVFDQQVKPVVIYSGRLDHLYDDTTALYGGGLSRSGWTGSKARMFHRRGPRPGALTNLRAVYSGAVATHRANTSGTSLATSDAAIQISMALRDQRNDPYRFFSSGDFPLPFASSPALARNRLMPPRIADELPISNMQTNQLPVMYAVGLIASEGYSFRSFRSIDPRIAARQRKLLAKAGGGVSVTQAAQQLNLSETEVDDLRAAGRLLAVLDPDSQDWSYPACQFAGPRIVPGLADVLGDFHVQSAWTRLYVLVCEDPALSGRTPITALKDGDLDLVREIISDYGQQGGA